MTSKERHEARYQRRKAARAAKKEIRNKGHDDFDQIFSYENLYKSYKKCRKGVAWKASTQKYISEAPLKILRTERQLQNGTYKSAGFHEFDLTERGKKRHIRAVNMDERVVQGCLCNNALIPAIKETFIYDNGACMEHKGYSFAINRCTQHLHEHYRKYGQEGYILQFDFSKFFDRIDHGVVYNVIDREFQDERTKALTRQFVDAFGDVGLGLGSPISQIFALSAGNKLDHYIKEKLHIREYGRYNDDGYLIHRSKEYLQLCLAKIREICAELKITINEKKTHIVRLRHGFTFLKAKFYLTKAGKVIRKLSRGSITRERRKLKAMGRLLWEGKMAAEDVYTSWQSWRAYARNFKSYETVKKMGELYDEVVVDEWLAA